MPFGSQFLFRAFRYEFRIVFNTLNEPMLWAVLLIGVSLWSLAYQVPFNTSISVGGDHVTHRREDDRPFLQGYSGSEPERKGVDWWTVPPYYGYRWMEPEAQVVLPGIGDGLWVLSITADSGRADGAAITSVWSVNGRRTTITFNGTAPSLRTYHILTNGDWGDLRLSIQTPRYNSPATIDSRELGFVLNQVQISSAGNTLRLPALKQLSWLILTLATLYALVRRLVSRIWLVLLVALSAAMLLTLCLLWERLALTVFTPTLTGLLVSCYALTILLDKVSTLWINQNEQAVGILWTNNERQAVVCLIILAFAVRLGGLLHPHVIFSDLRLNANNVLNVSLAHQGGIYFTEGLPNRAGGGQAPYPPGLYLLLLPFQLLFAPSMDARLTLLKITVALLDSLAIGAIWLMLRRWGRWAALLGAALYIAPPPLLSSFSAGEFANIGGQALTLPALVLLAMPSRREGAQLVPYTYCLSLSLSIALLGHMGVTISLVCLLLSVWLLWVVARLQLEGLWRRRLAVLTKAALGAITFVILFYYSAPIFVTIFTARLTSGASVTSAVTKADSLLRRLVSLLDPLRPGGNLTPLLIVLCLLGVMLLTRPTTLLQPTTLLLLAWLLGTVLSLGLLLVSDRGVRWQHFLYPALCLGAGRTLALIWHRGWAGRGAATICTFFIISYGLTFWIVQIRDYLH